MNILIIDMRINDEEYKKRKIDSNNSYNNNNMKSMIEYDNNLNFIHNDIKHIMNKSIIIQ